MIPSLPTHCRLPVLLALAGLVVVPALAATETAVYEVRFRADWSLQSHPQNFPPGPHFSNLIGGTHNEAVTFWEGGSLASDGIEAMAENGATSPLDLEVAAAVAAGDAFAVLRGPGIGNPPRTRSFTFTAHRDFPLVTLVSMIAPSPDWFVGVSGLSLFEDGDWVTETTVSLFAWDAGTDSGATFTSPNRNTDPPQAIRRITEGSLGNGVPLGSFIFVRQDSPPQPLELRDGRFRVTAVWRAPDEAAANAEPVALTEDTGYFWFSVATNVEVAVKVLDGCAVNGRFWVFAGGLTNLEVELVVEDTVSGERRTYTNDQGNPFQPIQDTRAFATCP